MCSIVNCALKPPIELPEERSHMGFNTYHTVGAWVVSDIRRKCFS